MVHYLKEIHDRSIYSKDFDLVVRRRVQSYITRKMCLPPGDVLNLRDIMPSLKCMTLTNGPSHRVKTEQFAVTSRCPKPELPEAYSSTCSFAHPIEAGTTALPMLLGNLDSNMWLSRNLII